MDIRKTFIENWPIKLASLALAVTLWFYVTSRGKTEISLTVPLELRNVPQGMAVVGDVPGTIEVRLQGQERALRDIAAGKNVVGTLDLSRGKEGENSIRLSPDDISRPSDVLVTHLSPFEIPVTLDHVIQKSFRLRPVLVGRPPAGRRVGAVSVTPPKITLEGPESVIESISILQTMPIDIGDMKDSVTIKPRIDYQGKPLTVLEQDISVSITIQKELP